MSSIPYIDMEATGRNIERLRLDKGLSVSQLQEQICFASAQAIYKWQRGASLPSIDNLIVLARVFGVRVDDILVVSDEKEKEKKER